MKRSCPQYDYDYKQLWETPEFKQLLADNQKLFSDVEKFTGEVIATPDDLQYVYNTLFIETLFGLPLPSWTNDFYPEAMQNISDFSFAIPSYNKALARLKVGEFFFLSIVSLYETFCVPLSLVHTFFQHHLEHPRWFQFSRIVGNTKSINLFISGSQCFHYTTYLVLSKNITRCQAV